MRLNKRLIGFLIVAASVLLLSSVGKAGTIYQVTPGGPYTAWFPLSGGTPDGSGDILLGGDVNNGTGSDWDVQSVIVWAAESIPIDPALYGGVISIDSNPLMQQEGSLYSITPAGSYVSASSGDTVPIWQLLFNVPEFVVPAGDDYVFAVKPESNGPTALLMSTGCLPDSCASWGLMEFAADGNAYNAGVVSPDANTFGDVNIILSDTDPVPEPTTWLLLGAGIGVLGLVRRRRG